MLFGAFFTAYFFIRVVADDGWFPMDGDELPKLIAGREHRDPDLLELHDALGAGGRAQREPRRAAGRACSPPCCWAPPSCACRSTSTCTWASPPPTAPRARSSTASPGLHGAHVFVGLTLLSFATIRAYRGHFTAKEHRGVEVPGHLLALRGRHVDRRVHLDLHPLTSGSLKRADAVLNPLRSEQEAFRFLIYVVVVVGRDRGHRAGGAGALSSFEHDLALAERCARARPARCCWSAFASRPAAWSARARARTWSPTPTATRRRRSPPCWQRSAPTTDCSPRRARRARAPVAAAG